MLLLERPTSNKVFIWKAPSIDRRAMRKNELRMYWQQPNCWWSFVFCFLSFSSQEAAMRNTSFFLSLSSPPSKVHVNWPRFFPLQYQECSSCWFVFSHSFVSVLSPSEKIISFCYCGNVSLLKKDDNDNLIRMKHQKSQSYCGKQC